MSQPAVPADKVVVQRADLGQLFGALTSRGYDVIGPRVRDGAVVLEHLAGDHELPAGVVDTQAPGSYRLARTDSPALFQHVVGPTSARRFLFPPRHLLWKVARTKDGLRFQPAEETPARLAFFGLRACELRALALQDQAYDNGQFTDPGYRARRQAAFIIAVNCTRAADTCFCTSMGSGPRARAGFDLALTEVVENGRHFFVVEAGSTRGVDVLASVRSVPATDADQGLADERVTACAAAMSRRMVDDAAGVLRRSLVDDHWDEIARRCLGCANCTLVCPTCFCSTVEDTTELDGGSAERWRTWDSCFTVDFSHIHGGPMRRSGSARYRQWLTHKLSGWHEQFGSSGCTGCGRCITWCPVGIDITAEARAFAERDARR